MDELSGLEGDVGCVTFSDGRLTSPPAGDGVEKVLPSQIMIPAPKIAAQRLATENLMELRVRMARLM